MLHHTPLHVHQHNTLPHTTSTDRLRLAPHGRTHNHWSCVHMGQQPIRLARLGKLCQPTQTLGGTYTQRIRSQR